MSDVSYNGDFLVINDEGFSASFANVLCRFGVRLVAISFFTLKLVFSFTCIIQMLHLGFMN